MSSHSKARQSRNNKSYSSLSALPSSYSSLNKSRGSIKKSRLQSRKQNNLDINSIQKTLNDEQKDKEDVDQDYDSTDSLDQLNDEGFIPNKSKPEHMKVNAKRTPRKSLVFCIYLILFYHPSLHPINIKRT